jgi:tetratricopeptide (TPR) repeat protein
MIFKRTIVAVSLLSMAVACGGGPSGKGAVSAEDASGKKDRSGQMVVKEAARNFEQALDLFVQHDKAQDWKESTCQSVAEKFLAASREQRSATSKDLPEAIYNAGLSYQRCGNDKEALEQFEAALAADRSFHRARAQLALYSLKRSGDIDQTIQELDQIIRDAKFQNAEALVALAALQMQRGSDASGPGCSDDLACAQLNLQRALAIDDSYMPAFNQLAIYYLEQAKAKAGSKSRGRGGRRQLVVSGAKGIDVNEQQLDLAALVASQAQRKNPNYAPIHNTTGLILVELKNFNGAVKSFGRARQLDPKFFEAHMNYAAVNLSFRGFGEAERAYRNALKLRPKEFEAHLGLALAIRGQINPGNWDKAVSEAQRHLEQAKKLDPSRAEPYYNEAILTQEFRAKRSEDASAVPVLEKAAQQYREFINKAGGDPAFAEAVKRAKDRTQDIEDMVKFIREGEQAAKDADAAAAAAKAEAAKAEAEKKEAEKKAAADKKEAEKKAVVEKKEATPAKK